jgi:hypothetical protein
MQKNNKCNQKSFIDSRIIFLIFSTPIVCSVNAEMTTNTEQSSTNAEISTTGETSNKKQPIGESPTDDASRDISHLFLRDTEVLLNPREIRVSIGFSYTTDENQRSFRKNRNRSISTPLNINYGLTKRLEVNASVPFLYNENEIISATNVSDSSASGIGDLALGLFYTLKSESNSSPAITTSLNVTTPTGDTADPADLNGLSTGAGFWGLSTGLSLSKTIDPAIVFFNVGYQHTFDDDQFGSNIQPGDTFNYGFGAGLSVNSSVAFSARVSGSYQKETKLNNQQVRGTSSEPIYLIFSMSYRLSYETRLETTFNLGASDDAGDIGMGFSYIWNL